MIDRFPFREDEAIYSYWALHGWHQDPFFLSIWPDKPPLFLWLLGATYTLFGIEPASARWINIAASTLTIPVVAVTARRLWGEPSALIAALVMALSPFAISFSPTAFVDPVLVLAGSLALCMAVFARPLAAGLWLGVAMMTKQQGLLYLPLIIALLTSNRFAGRASDERDEQVNPTDHAARVAYRAARFLCGLALVVLPVVFWDSRRWASAPSPWDLSIRNYARLMVTPPQEWPQRLLDWWPILWHLTASSATWMVLALSLLSATLMVGYRRRMQGATDRRSIGPAVIIALWAAGYLSLHIVSTIQVWDRYLLPLGPPLALLSSWAASMLPFPTSSWMRVGAVGMIVLLLTFPAGQAAVGALPVGGDHGDYSGLDDALDWVDEQAEMQERQIVLYHDTLGWHLQFYLYNQIERDGFALRWFPSSTYLADNAEKTPHLRKFYVQPDWAPHADLVGRLKMRNLALVNRFESAHFTVYEVVDNHVSTCAWCLCVQPGDKRYDGTGWQELHLDPAWPKNRMASMVDIAECRNRLCR